MAVVRGNVLTSPHTPTYVAGVLLLGQRASSIRPDQLNASSIVQRAPEARIFGTAVERSRPLSWWDLLTWWHVAAMHWLTVPTGSRAWRPGLCTLAPPLPSPPGGSHPVGHS
jgi:hypothetical protein